jgi:hypothetical protein
MPRGWNKGLKGDNAKSAQIVITCPCGQEFKVNAANLYASRRKYCKLECSYKFSTTRGKKKNKFIPWNKGLKGVQEAWNKGIPHSNETIEKLRINSKHAQTPETRKIISETSLEHWKNQTFRDKIVPKITGRGNGWARTLGGQGRQSTPDELMFAAILLPIGYVHNHIVGCGKGNRGHWIIDFALIENKIAFEIDGSSHHHKDRQNRDTRKDAYLHSLGWKVIRIKL